MWPTASTTSSLFCRRSWDDIKKTSPVWRVGEVRRKGVEMKRAKACGFQGKILIHPNQIEPCHEVFTPTAEEVEYARQVIAAFEQAEREGRAAIQLEGKFIDYPVVEKARRICTLIDAIEGKN
jgi:citrate lyase beta subunit